MWLAMPDERPNIQRLHAYVPGEQPGYRETLGGGDFGDGSVKLNSNENPYPPSDSVMLAIRGLSPEALRLYPPADAAEIRQTAGELHGLSAQHVIATNGGDELLRLLITVYCPPATDSVSAGGGIGMTDPSYTLYPVLAHIQDTPVTVVPREGDQFRLPADYAQQLNDAGCQLAFIVNPHAPTGQLESLETLRKLAADFDGILVIDEAYVDFAPHNALPLLHDGSENVVILRSMSKGYSLAGLRFGYGLASPAVIGTLDKARDSYNTDILGQAAAAAALRDQTYAQSTWDRTIAERNRLAAALRERGFVVRDSHTNFVLAAVPGGDQQSPDEQAKTIYEALKQNSVLIRYFSKPRLTDKLRITVGTPAQNDQLLRILDSVLP